MATHLALARVEFEYQAQTEDEITVQEDQVVWVLEDDDPESVPLPSLLPGGHRHTSVPYPHRRRNVKLTGGGQHRP